MTIKAVRHGSMTEPRHMVLIACVGDPVSGPGEVSLWSLDCICGWSETVSGSNTKANDTAGTHTQSLVPTPLAPGETQSVTRTDQHARKEQHHDQ